MKLAKDGGGSCVLAAVPQSFIHCRQVQHFQKEEAGKGPQVSLEKNRTPPLFPATSLEKQEPKREILESPQNIKK